MSDKFCGRIRYKDGTFGLSNSMSMEEMLEGLLAYLPVDIIYTTRIDESGIIDMKPIGRVGLSFKAFEANSNLKVEDKYHEKEVIISRQDGIEQIRQESNQGREGDSDGGRRPVVDQGQQHGSVSGTVPKKRRQSKKKHDGGFESVGEAGGGSLTLDASVPYDEGLAATIKSDQKKRRGRPPLHNGPSQNKDGKKAKEKFANQFGLFGSRE